MNNLFNLMIFYFQESINNLNNLIKEKCLKKNKYKLISIEKADLFLIWHLAIHQNPLFIKKQESRFHTKENTRTNTHYFSGLNNIIIMLIMIQH